MKSAKKRGELKAGGAAAVHAVEPPKPLAPRGVPVLSGKRRQTSISGRASESSRHAPAAVTDRPGGNEHRVQKRDGRLEKRWSRPGGSAWIGKKQTDGKRRHKGRIKAAAKEAPKVVGGKTESGIDGRASLTRCH